MRSHIFAQASFILKPVKGFIPGFIASVYYCSFSITVLPTDIERWDPYFIRSLTRFSDAGIIPPLSAEQIEAMEVLETTCKRLSLHMILEVGDLQFLSNEHVLHSRTEYKDHAPPPPRRHLMRLWLATPEREGGGSLPFHDSDEKKRGGIQVDEVGPVAELDAA